MEPEGGFPIPIIIALSQHSQQLATEQDEVDAEMAFIIKNNSVVNTVWRENENIFIGVDKEICNFPDESFNLIRKNSDLNVTIEHNKTPSLSVFRFDPSQAEELKKQYMSEFFHPEDCLSNNQSEAFTHNGKHSTTHTGSPSSDSVEKQMTMEPLVGGHPIINSIAGNELGTVGCVLKIKKNEIEERLILSNAHVVFGQEFRNLNNRNKIYHFLSKKNLGEVAAHGMRDFNPEDQKHKNKETTECYGYIDFATCTLDPEVEHKSWRTRTGLINGVVQAQISDPVSKVGFRSLQTHGTYTRNVSLKVNYKGNFLIFNNIMLITPDVEFENFFSRNGDSGSVVMKDNKMVGLLFADTDNSGEVHDITPIPTPSDFEVPSMPIAASDQLSIDVETPQQVQEWKHTSYAFHIHDVLACMGVDPSELIFDHDSWASVK